MFRFYSYYYLIPAENDFYYKSETFEALNPFSRWEQLFLQHNRRLHKIS